MALTGNKGEWAEIYTFFKLLGEQKLYAGDENLDRIEKIFYPILNILRSEEDINYDYSTKQDIVIVSENGEEKLRIPVANFIAKAKELLNIIQTCDGTFAAPEIEQFMNSIFCQKLKAKSIDKTDIKIIIHDLRTGMTPTLGFSIKSQIGADSTLLNASKATNFVYQIDDISLTDIEIEEINSINTKSKIQDQVRTILAKGGRFIFKSIDNQTFYNNLVLIDSCLPQILSHILFDFFSTKRKTVKDLINFIANQNPIHYDTSGSHLFYQYKIKSLLTDVALGMTPSSIWDGKYDANGGYLVVKEDGDVLCYHIYDKNLFEEYLFNNTRLESPSTTRYKYAKIEKQADNTLLFKLNLQIRFI